MLSLGAHHNQIINNWIGINWNDTVIPNEFGVVILGGAADNTIGGDRPGTVCASPCNLISGNSYAGVEIAGSATQRNGVKGNYIGVDTAGQA